MRLIRCYLQYIHSPRDLRSAFRLRRLAKIGGRSSRLRSRCGPGRIFGLGDHFSVSWQAQGNLVVVDIPRQVQGIGAALLRRADLVAGVLERIHRKCWQVQQSERLM